MDISLFEVVPWTHGYAHSWALRWMLTDDQDARDQLLGLFLPEGEPPWRVEGMIGEFKVRGNRADLHFESIDATGRRTAVLIETKVNDALRKAQIEAYCATGAEVIVYGPGMTGLLHADGPPIDRERWITGRQVVDVLGDAGWLPDLLRSYLAEVGAQAARMQAARKAARGGPDFDRAPDRSGVSADDLEAVAWVAEIAAEMRARGADWVEPRNTAHDYGIFWSGSWTPLVGEAGLYVDVIAGHGGSEYVITVKVGSGEPEDRVEVFDTAIRAGAPWEGWTRGRRSRARSYRAWKLDASEMTAQEAADATIRAGVYMNTVAQGARREHGAAD